MILGDLWPDMVSRKSHVSELKNWMPKHSKKPSVGVELRAGGDPHRSKKPRWSAVDMRQWPKKGKKRCIGIQFLPREFCKGLGQEQPSKKQLSEKATVREAVKILLLYKRMRKNC